MESLQNFSLGWRRSKAGKKYHLFDVEEKPLCGKRMKNVFLAEEVHSSECLCKKCELIREKGEMS